MKAAQKSNSEIIRLRENSWAVATTLGSTGAIADGFQVTSQEFLASRIVQVLPEIPIKLTRLT